ncbi:F0F1 ATP synthase subunit delta [Variovorax sp. dw_954]|uniref:F0F1 ATP synthase subunit delta n=1 Tax=Variovorax sp. dw_954 TaxID=2720078 RepID=UPI001BD509B0|nr:F0F1 ATP synthase subunit delta [Variovorax sp. dw_954]
MLIDWFTVGAQALNFLVLVWLMKRFLYKPVQDAIAAREKRIADELADADARKVEANKEREDFQRKNADFDRDRAALFAAATSDADADRQRLRDVAHSAAEALAAKRQETLAGDAQRLNESVRDRTVQEVFAIARRALADLASTSLEASACEVFTQRLRALDGSAREGLDAALKSGNGPALVRSAFALPKQQRDAVQHAINETFSMDAPLQFEVAPELVGGIELSAQGHKFAWSISDYLGSLDRGVGELLKARAAPASTPSSSLASSAA